MLFPDRSTSGSASGSPSLESLLKHSSWLALLAGRFTLPEAHAALAG